MTTKRTNRVELRAQLLTRVPPARLVCICPTHVYCTMCMYRTYWPTASINVFTVINAVEINPYGLVWAPQFSNHFTLMNKVEWCKRKTKTVRKVMLQFRCSATFCATTDTSPYHFNQKSFAIIEAGDFLIECDLIRRKHQSEQLLSVFNGTAAFHRKAILFHHYNSKTKLLYSLESPRLFVFILSLLVDYERQNVGAPTFFGDSAGCRIWWCVTIPLLLY